jgi:hypothetical protein
VDAIKGDEEKAYQCPLRVLTNPMLKLIVHVYVFLRDNVTPNVPPDILPLY